MFCPNCGKEIAEGEVCTCMQGSEEVVNETAVSSEETADTGCNNAEQGYYAPEAEAPVQGYYEPQPAPVYAPPIAAYARTDYPEGYKIKKKYVALLLAWFFGVYGAHNFYLGEKTKGLVQVLLSTVGFIFTLGLSYFAVQIWVLIEMIGLFTESNDSDANGFKIMTLEESIAREMRK